MSTNDTAMSQSETRHRSFASPPKLLESVAHLKPRSPREKKRPWHITCRDDHDSMSGLIAANLEEIIDKVIANIREGEAENVPKNYPTVDDYHAHWVCDYAIWGTDDLSLAAVVLVRPGGIQVIRLDAEIPEPPAAVGPTNAAWNEVGQPNALTNRAIRG